MPAIGQEITKPSPGDEHVANQVRKQYADLSYEGQRDLDFSAFEAELAQFDETRIAELDPMLLSATIADIQQMFGAGELTSEELVLYYLHRIQKYDHRFNSVLELNPDALTIARGLDQERAAGNIRGPMHGIPALLKDNIGTGDQTHTTAGAKVMENARSDRDAFLAKKLREAGAIILGKTNLSEWANFMTSDSANGFSILGGQTRNPYGRFDVGGSSSGSAVAAAAHFATVTVGTETTGSIIYPASQNSVVGLKPSLGLISRDRIIPISDVMDTAGPITRNVTDLAILLSALAGADDVDPQTTQAIALAETDFSKFLNAEGLRGLRIGVTLRSEEKRRGDTAILQRAMATLREAGAEVVEIPELSAKPEFEEAWLRVLLIGFHSGVNAYLQAIGNRAPASSVTEIIAFNKADLPNRAPFGQDLLESAAAIPLNRETFDHYDALANFVRNEGAQAIRATLQTYNLDLILDLSNYASRFYATAGFPALTVPVGYRDSGEPVGITFIGDYLDEPELIAAAYAFEQASKVRKNPPLYE